MKVVLGVTGGIAAYKAADIASKLVQRGDEVLVVMTDAAQRFVTSLTFESITGKAVLRDLWHPPPDHRPVHVSTARWGDVIAVAPATANFMGKVAAGIADDLLTSVVMAAPCPIVFAPAMNDRMWTNPILQENLKKLEKVGYHLVPPEKGWLADGYVGVGRLAATEKILGAIDAHRPKRRHDPGDEQLLARS